MTGSGSHDTLDEAAAPFSTLEEQAVKGAAPETESASPASTADAAGEYEEETGECAQCAGYLDAVTRLKAEFANFRRRAAEQQAQASERGAADLVARLLPVLDASEAGAVHHGDVVGPLHGALVDALIAEGLEVIFPTGELFDPNYHEAAIHESGETPGEQQVVTDVLRTGYAWGGRVLRPAVVGVRG